MKGFRMMSLSTSKKSFFLRSAVTDLNIDNRKVVRFSCTAGGVLELRET